MSLKVLLADDSAAIKKVVQLSLQDFGILLKTVGSGKDVLDVARAFQPDIALVDVLLPHKTGYEIAAELKSDPQLSKTPIIMLWSSFMAFDEKKFKASGAEDKLEKPFEVAGLRGLINKYVPRTQSSDLSKHLEFPTLEFGGAKNKPNPHLEAAGLGPSPGQPHGQPTTPAPQAFQAPPPPAKNPIPSNFQIPAAASEGENWSMDSFEDISKFGTQEPEKSADTKSPFQMPNFFNQPAAPSREEEPSSEPSANAGMWSGDSEWVRKDLSKFKVSVPDEAGDENQSFESPNEQISNTDFLLKPQSKNEPAHGSSSASQAAAAPILAPLSMPTAVQKAASIPDRGSDLFMTPIPNEPPPADQPPRTTATKSVASIGNEVITEALAQEIRSQAREIIEKVIWKVVPEIASNMIKEELQRLLGEEK